MPGAVKISAPVEVSLPWGELEALVLAKSLRLQRQEQSDSWVAWATEAQTVYHCKVYKAGSEPVGADLAQNAVDLAGIVGAAAGAAQATRSHPELLVGERDSDLDGCETPLILGGWARACFALTANSHLAFAHSKSYRCLPGDLGTTVLIHPAGRLLLAVEVSQGASSFDAGAQAAVYAACERVEFWAGPGDTEDLLACYGVASVDGTTVNLSSPVVDTIPAGSQAVSVIRSYSPLRGSKGLDGGARFIGTQTEQLGNPGEISALIPAGLEIGIRLFAKTSRAAGAECALALTTMLRGPEA